MNTSDEESLGDVISRDDYEERIVRGNIINEPREESVP